MKNKGILALLLAAAFSMAQQASAQMFSWGVKGGVGLHGYRLSKSVNDDWDQQVGLGAQFGTAAMCHFNGRLALQVEAYYSQMGAKMSSDTEFPFPEPVDTANGQAFLKERLNFLTVPLLIRFESQDPERGWFLIGGPTLGFALKGKREVQIEPKTGKPHIYPATDLEFGTSSRDNYDNLDVSVTLGAGFFKYIEDAGTFQFDLRAVIGTRDLIAPGQSPMVLFPSNSNYTTFGLQASICYLFEL